MRPPFPVNVEAVDAGRVHADDQRRVVRDAALVQRVAIALVALLALRIRAMVDIRDVLVAVVDQVQHGVAHTAAIIRLDKRAGSS